MVANGGLGRATARGRPRRSTTVYRVRPQGPDGVVMHGVCGDAPLLPEVPKHDRAVRRGRRTLHRTERSWRFSALVLATCDVAAPAWRGRTKVPSSLRQRARMLSVCPINLMLACSARGSHRRITCTSACVVHWGCTNEYQLEACTIRLLVGWAARYFFRRAGRNHGAGLVNGQAVD